MITDDLATQALSAIKRVFTGCRIRRTDATPFESPDFVHLSTVIDAEKAETALIPAVMALASEMKDRKIRSFVELPTPTGAETRYLRNDPQGVIVRLVTMWIMCPSGDDPNGPDPYQAINVAMAGYPRALNSN